MTIAALQEEDGSNSVSLDPLPEIHGSDTYQTANRNRYGLTAQDNQGRTMFYFVTSTPRAWHLAWTDVAVAFAESVLAKGQLRRVRFLPDEDVSETFYICRVVNPRPPIQQPNGLVSFEINLEALPT